MIFQQGFFFVEFVGELFLSGDYRVLGLKYDFISTFFYEAFALKAKIDSRQIIKTKGIVKCPQSRKLTTEEAQPRPAAL